MEMEIIVISDDEEEVTTLDEAPVAPTSHHPTTSYLPPPSSPPSPSAASSTQFEGDAYVTHMSLVLRTVTEERADLRALYAPHELELAAKFLGALPPLAQYVYARLFQRKGPWFRVTTLLSYFAPRRRFTSDDNNGNGDGDDRVSEPQQPQTAAKALSVDPAVVQSTLQALLNTGLLTTLTLLPPSLLTPEDQEVHLQTALSALQQCATTGELASLWKKLSGSKSVGKKVRPPPPSSSPSSTSSPSRGGGSAGNGTSKPELLQAIKSLATTQRRIDGSRLPLAKIMHPIWLATYRQHPALQQVCIEDLAADDVVVVVQLSPMARSILQRMHKLFYLHAVAPLGIPGAGPVSLASANRVRTFQQILQSKLTSDGGSSSSSSSSSATVWPGLLVTFKRVVYPTYEVCTHAPVFESRERYVCFELAARMRRIMDTVETEMVLTVDDDEEEMKNYDGDDGGVWCIPAVEGPRLLAFQRLHQTMSQGVGAEEEYAVDDWYVDISDQFENCLASMETLDAFVDECRRCFYVMNQSASGRPQGFEGVDRPAFYERFHAGHHLARVLHSASGVYERQKRYVAANRLLRELLQAPFVARKRGYWWERLACNLEHDKHHEQARQACTYGLQDPHVVGSHRITLTRRGQRLSQRKRKNVAANLSAGEAVCDDGGDFEDDAVVNLLSSEDGDSMNDGQPQQGDALKTDQAGTAEESDRMTNWEPYAYRQAFIVGRPLNRNTGERSRFIGYDDEPCTVEQLVLQYYASEADADVDAVGTASKIEKDKPTLTAYPGHAGQGWYGVHCEGTVLTNLFGLFLWDVLYASVPDVFQCEYQLAPLDFGCADAFYASRQGAVDALLYEIEHTLTIDELLARLAHTWRQHEGEATQFVSWGSPSRGDSRATLPFHQLVVLAMGGPALARLLRHMATSREYHYAQNGLPDLLLLRLRRRREQDERGNQKERQAWSSSEVVDVYSFCGMTHTLNLNEQQSSSSRGRPVVNAKKVDPLPDAGTVDHTMPGTESMAVGAVDQDMESQELSVEMSDDTTLVLDHELLPGGVVDHDDGVGCQEENKEGLQGDMKAKAEDQGEDSTLRASDWEVQLMLVEVKGPRDRLSDQQEYWLEVLNERVGVDASVLHVVEDESVRTKRQQGKRRSGKTSEQKKTPKKENENEKKQKKAKKAANTQSSPAKRKFKKAK